MQKKKHSSLRNPLSLHHASPSSATASATGLPSGANCVTLFLQFFITALVVLAMLFVSSPRRACKSPPMPAATRNSLSQVMAGWSIVPPTSIAKTTKRKSPDRSGVKEGTLHTWCSFLFVVGQRQHPPARRIQQQLPCERPDCTQLHR